MWKTMIVAWREFKHTALTKAFIFGTIFFPLIIWGGIVVGSIIVRPSETTVQGTLAILDPTGEVFLAAEQEFDPERFKGPTLGEMMEDAARGTMGAIVHLDMKLEAHTDRQELETLQNRVREQELLAVAVVGDGVLDTANRDGRVVLYVDPAANPDHISAIQRTLGRSVVRARATQRELDVAELRAMLRDPQIVTRRLTDVGEAAAGVELQKMLPIAFMVLLWICAFASGNYLLTTTIEEKSNRVMEVLLSAISPMQLMAGKIIGQCVVGIFTIAVYGALGIGALFYFSMHDVIEISQLVYVVVYFFMAYLMIAAMMASIGSAVSDLQEAHALLTPAMLLLMVPWILFMPVSQNPNGTIATVTSFIPPLTPFVMVMRVTSSEPPATLQIIATMVVGWGGAIVMMWLCARIFRVGVLMTGKPPSPLELIRWLRYS
ncbi:MAG: ABC transporter permease [Phycisphaerales bacterium]|nr:MAG: ABC transporter permease [Phycisphaerales bacterium]